MLTTILATAFVFGLLVLAHEWGHFAVAKAMGMRVDEFAIGFGPRLWSARRGETLYSLRCVPLGGFTDIAGMDPADNDAGERGYSAKPPWRRLATILAGPAMNLVLPVFIFFALFLTVGISAPSRTNQLGDLMPNLPAQRAGLRPGDVVERINGQSVANWDDMVALINAAGTEPLAFEVRRNGEALRATLAAERDPDSGRLLVGITSPMVHYQPGIAQSAVMSVQRTCTITRQMLLGLARLVRGEDVAELSGPLGVAQMAGEVTATGGFAALMNFAALLSLNLGIINLVPIPALDGGHVLVTLLETLAGRRLSAQALHYTQVAGVTVLVAIMLFATRNDLVRILGM